MNARLRQIDEWRRERVRREPAKAKGRNGPGLAIRERTVGSMHEQVFDGCESLSEKATRGDESDPVLTRDELWSILNRMPREQAGILERVYLQGGSISAEGKTRVYRARLAAREVAS